MYSTIDVMPFDVQFLFCYNGITSLRVAQEDGHRVRKVAGSVSIKQLHTAEKPWPFGILLR